jgi:hydrogenase nickel incorporation protein HypA/HybF
MHEVALCESVMRIIEDEARANAFRRVRTVWLELGALSCAEPDAMALAFRVASRGTLAEGARLELLRTAGEAWCLTCSKAVPLAARYDPCPDCGGFRLEMTAGDALRVKELEVE